MLSLVPVVHDVVHVVHLPRHGSNPWMKSRIDGSSLDASSKKTSGCVRGGLCQDIMLSQRRFVARCGRNRKCSSCLECLGHRYLVVWSLEVGFVAMLKIGLTDFYIARQIEAGRAKTRNMRRDSWLCRRCD